MPCICDCRHQARMIKHYYESVSFNETPNTTIDSWNVHEQLYILNKDIYTDFNEYIKSNISKSNMEMIYNKYKNCICCSRHKDNFPEL
jgi:hypothetical protein